MGLFRRRRNSDTAYKTEPAPVVETPKFTVVILEFPPNFDPNISAPVNRRLMFQHETDSIVSKLSDCSCRLQYCRRRPECCVECNYMKEQAVTMNKQQQHQPPPPITRTTSTETADPSMTEGSTTNQKQNIKVISAPSLGLLAKIVSSPPGASKKNSNKHRGQEHQPLLEPSPLSMTLSPTHSPCQRQHRKTQSADTGFFGKTFIGSSFGHHSQAITVESLSLDHELA